MVLHKYFTLWRSRSFQLVYNIMYIKLRQFYCFIVLFYVSVGTLYFKKSIGNFFLVYHNTEIQIIINIKKKDQNIFPSISSSFYCHYYYLFKYSLHLLLIELKFRTYILVFYSSEFLMMIRQYCYVTELSKKIICWGTSWLPFCVLLKSKSK